MKRYFSFKRILVLCFIFCFFIDLKAQKLKTIVIDPGHGGIDAGCLGQSHKEKDIALAISLKLGNYIKELLPELKVVYTRDDDTFIGLEERAKIANKNKADFFVSIHCNANTNKEAYGTEVYTMGLSLSDQNITVAKRENSVILLEEDYEKDYQGFDPNSATAYIMFSLYQNENLEQSLQMASKIDYQFKSRLGRHSRGVKQERFWVLWRTAMPSLLVETGFLTNPVEEKFLASEEGQDYIASAIYRAIKEYKKEMEGLYPK